MNYSIKKHIFMKILALFCAFAVFSTMFSFIDVLKIEALSGEDEIPNNSTGIPDKNFYDFVVQEYGSDGKITVTQAEAVTNLTKPNNWDPPENGTNIKSIVGIGFFKNITRFQTRGEEIKFLPSDIAECTKLEDLYIRDNNGGIAVTHERLNAFDYLSLDYLENIDKITTLKSFDFSFSNLTSLKGLPHNKEMNFARNGLANVPIDWSDAANKAWDDYFNRWSRGHIEAYDRWGVPDFNTADPDDRNNPQVIIQEDMVDFIVSTYVPNNTAVPDNTVSSDVYLAIKPIVDLVKDAEAKHEAKQKEDPTIVYDPTTYKFTYHDAASIGYLNLKGKNVEKFKGLNAVSPNLIFIELNDNGLTSIADLEELKKYEDGQGLKIELGNNPLNSAEIWNSADGQSFLVDTMDYLTFTDLPNGTNVPTPTIQNDRTGITDRAFYEYLLEEVGLTKDDVLTPSDVRKISELVIEDTGTITSLTGIRFLVNLTSLTIRGSAIPSIPVEIRSCNQLENLEISNHAEGAVLSLANNALKGLNPVSINKINLSGTGISSAESFIRYVRDEVSGSGRGIELIIENLPIDWGLASNKAIIHYLEKDMKFGDFTPVLPPGETPPEPPVQDTRRIKTQTTFPQTTDPETSIVDPTEFDPVMLSAILDVVKMDHQEITQETLTYHHLESLGWIDYGWRTPALRRLTGIKHCPNVRILYFRANEIQRFESLDELKTFPVSTINKGVKVALRNNPINASASNWMTAQGQQFLWDTKDRAEFIDLPDDVTYPTADPEWVYELGDETHVTNDNDPVTGVPDKVFYDLLVKRFARDDDDNEGEKLPLTVGDLGSVVLATVFNAEEMHEVDSLQGIGLLSNVPELTIYGSGIVVQRDAEGNPVRDANGDPVMLDVFSTYTELPEDLEKLTKLKKLTIRETRLTTSKNLDKIPAIEELVLVTNLSLLNFPSLPTTLKRLTIDGDITRNEKGDLIVNNLINLDTVPTAVSRLTELVYLRMNNTNIRTISNISNLKKLMEIRFQGCPRLRYIDGLPPNKGMSSFFWNSGPNKNDARNIAETDYLRNKMAVDPIQFGQDANVDVNFTYTMNMSSVRNNAAGIPDRALYNVLDSHLSGKGADMTRYDLASIGYFDNGWNKGIKKLTNIATYLPNLKYLAIGGEPIALRDLEELLKFNHVITVYAQGLGNGVFSWGSVEAQAFLKKSQGKIIWEFGQTSTRPNPVVYYNVTFKNRGKTIVTRKVQHGSPAIAPKRPTRTGYTFNGWDKKFNRVTAKMTVNAKWKIKKYDVRFVDRGRERVVKRVKIDHNKKVRAIKAPARKGFRFLGWYQDTKYKKKFNFNRKITKKQSIYAYYVRIPTAPKNFKLTALPNRQIRANWRSIKGQTYTLEMSTNPRTGFRRIYNKRGNSFTQRNLVSGTTYYFRIRTFRTVKKTRLTSKYSRVLKAQVF